MGKTTPKKKLMVNFSLACARAVAHAMEAGISDHIWSFQEIAALADAKLARLAA
jgi:hypothetical protein